MPIYGPDTAALCIVLRTYRQEITGLEAQRGIYWQRCKPWERAERLERVRALAADIEAELCRREAVS